MFFPIHTDRRLQSTPWLNYALVAANVAAFILTRQAWRDMDDTAWLLHPTNPKVWHGISYQFITYQFLHADAMHLLGNMLFLFVFGNSVEDRLGKAGYLFFYLGGGVLAGLGHAMVEDNPVLGASGSVAAVTGAYLALFPLSNVTIVYFFIFIGTFEISSMYLILFQIAQNLVFQLMGSGGVAYSAHLAGYGYGFMVGMGLLWTRLLPREPYDLLSMWEHRRRRSEFAKLTREGYHPWEGGKAPTGGGGEASAALTAKEKEVMDIRGRITAAIGLHDLKGATEEYERLLEMDSAQVMGQDQQLDLANQLTSEGKYSQASRAYELFLNTYTKYPQREQVELILGLICARYLNRKQRAVELLNAALGRLRDPDQIALAKQTLGEVKG